jgi:NAD(P)-dependent dehydrogenase (short-subunit alcohol dehydrogenase family)
MAENLSGKVAIVTGASSGVGEATVRLFAKRGAKVVLAARTAEKIEALAREVGALAVPTDVTKREDLRALVEKTVSAHGRLDVLVNNAGFNSRGAFDSLSLEGIEAVIDTNLKAPMLLTRIALPHLRAARGVVVNVASIAGHIPLPGESPYCASKWGLRGFTFAVREELRTAGVALCAVSPGPIATPFILDDIDHTPDLVFSQPFLTAEQVAEAVAACAVDRKRERALPQSTLWLARLGQWMPWLQEMLRPALEKKGARVKEQWRARGARPI